MASHTYAGEEIAVRGRRFTLNVTSHRDDEVSYDVVDVATGETLTEMSLDYYPYAKDVEYVLDDLGSALRDGDLSSYFDGKHDLLLDITDHVRLTVRIENTYSTGTVITGETVVVPRPGNLGDLEDWATEHLYPLTGTGQTQGESAYDLEITDSTEPALVGQKFDWGY